MQREFESLFFALVARSTVGAIGRTTVSAIVERPLCRQRDWFERRREVGARGDELLDADAAQRIEDAEHIEKPEDEQDDDHRVQDAPNLRIHRDETIHHPKQYAHDDDDEDYGEKGHEKGYCTIRAPRISPSC